MSAETVPPVPSSGDAKSSEVPGGKSPIANLFLIITNISKRANVRSLLLTAAAFGCRTVFVAGQKKFNFDPDGPDIPVQIRQLIVNGGMTITRFDKLDECVHHIKNMGNDGTSSNSDKSNCVEIIGVEIDESAVDVEEFQFRGDTCFMMGNEGQGMNTKQKSFCDRFLMISQYGSGTASLNVNVAASIVLHRFHHWARGDVIG